MSTIERLEKLLVLAGIDEKDACQVDRSDITKCAAEYAAMRERAEAAERRNAELVAERDALRDALMDELCALYWAAYDCGHHDTVESRFTDVLSVDRFSYHLDAVSQFIHEGDMPNLAALAHTSRERETSPQGEIAQEKAAAIGAHIGEEGK